MPLNNFKVPKKNVPCAGGAKIADTRNILHDRFRWKRLVAVPDAKAFRLRLY